jgi:hypothetical protein
MRGRLGAIVAPAAVAYLAVLIVLTSFGWTPCVNAAPRSRIVDLLTTKRIDGERMLDPLLGARWLREVTEDDLVRVLHLIAGPDFAGGSQIRAHISKRRF